jgi:hypothetical protein
MFHTLRRFRAAHGHTRVGARHADADDHDAVTLGRWV